VWGVETSEVAVAHSRSVFNLENVVLGSLPNHNLERQSFDVIYIWHVIEHVTDLDAFVASAHGLLRPGGLLWIGTENYRNANFYFGRAIYRLRGIPAPFATASEHTLVFEKKTLQDCLSRRGFDVQMREAYQLPLEEKKQTMQFRSTLGYLYFAAQHAANGVFRTGPLMRLAARKR
jgi:2-polyprenyl-3-methyl-5-hydroxy-6-metoxy-1,4-benzoquinol methylase